jgi:hypothetical protein
MSALHLSCNLSAGDALLSGGPGSGRGLYPTKKDPRYGGLLYFSPVDRRRQDPPAPILLSDLLFFFLFDLIDKRLECAVKRLFKGLGRTFYEKMVLGNMDPDLRDLVLDGVNHIVQL